MITRFVRALPRDPKGFYNNILFRKPPRNYTYVDFSSWIDHSRLCYYPYQPGREKNTTIIIHGLLGILKTYKISLNSKMRHRQNPWNSFRWLKVIPKLASHTSGSIQNQYITVYELCISICNKTFFTELLFIRNLRNHT